MPIALSTPARWPALLFFCVVCLQGCSLLPRGEHNATADTASTPVNDSSALPAFTLEVNAPDGVRETLERHLELQRFRALPDLQDGELQRLLAAADANARELLGTMGYFAPTITVLMTDTPESKAALRAVVVVVEPGPQTRIASTQITVADSTDKDTESHARREQRVQRNWSLLPGQPFTQSAWDSAKADGLRQLQVRRYPTARIAQSRAEVDADTHQAALSVNYDTGPSYRFGPLKVQGSERYDPDGARRLARLPTGAFYDEAQLLDAQLRLASSGYYDAVFLTLDTEGTDPQAAPVVAQLREAKLQKLVFGAGISTDSGPRLSMDHIHNQLPGIGWRAVSKLLLDRETKLASTEWTDLPDENGWRWFASAQAQRETTGDYQVNSARLRSGRSKSGARIDRNYFLQYDYANSQGLNAPPSGTAISVNYGWTGRYFNSTETGGARNARIALRAEAGAVMARQTAQIPVTQLFLTGGDTTVRGYGYRAIGARTENNLLYGGRYLGLASVEWQRPIVYNGAMTDWESAVFVDAGAVADRVGDLDPRVGVGAGVRWRSPVGPLQADLAYGVQSRQLRLHLRLGFSF
jgi:translocation and assembly module TamA